MQGVQTFSTMAIVDPWMNSFCCSSERVWITLNQKERFRKEKTQLTPTAKRHLRKQFPTSLTKEQKWNPLINLYGTVGSTCLNIVQYSV